MYLKKLGVISLCLALNINLGMAGSDSERDAEHETRRPLSSRTVVQFQEENKNPERHPKSQPSRWDRMCSHPATLPLAVTSTLIVTVIIHWAAGAYTPSEQPVPLTCPPLLNLPPVPSAIPCFFPSPTTRAPLPLIEDPNNSTDIQTALYEERIGNLTTELGDARADAELWKNGTQVMTHRSKAFQDLAGDLGKLLYSTCNGAAGLVQKLSSGFLEKTGHLYPKDKIFFSQKFASFQNTTARWRQNCVDQIASTAMTPEFKMVLWQTCEVYCIEFLNHILENPLASSPESFNQKMDYLASVVNSTTVENPHSLFHNL